MHMADARAVFGTGRRMPMRYRKIIPVEDAVALIRDGDVIASSGYGGTGTPEALFAALASGGS